MNGLFSRRGVGAEEFTGAGLADHLRAMRRGVASLVLTSFVLSPYGALADGPVAAVGAPANQTPTVSTVGAVPVVNIATPGVNGISHNKYERFDVPAAGTVLNNSATAVTSVLAGPLGGNPNLAAGSARVILNEVTSSQPSSLLGQLEVAGASARVVIANPNGIACNGCGFINTPHVQLAAARPFFEGDALRFDLGAGRLDVGPLGLKALATRLDLIAGTIATTGPLESRAAINMVAGGDASVGESLDTRFNGSGHSDGGLVAIDIGQSVSAGSVRLVLDSQTKRPIRISGAIQADEDVMVASRGSITIGGPIRAGRDVGIANRDGWLEVSSALPADQPVISAGNDVQILGFQARIPYVAAGHDIEIGIGQEALIGYSDYAFGEFPRLSVGNDLRLITGRSLVMPFRIEQATVGRDLVAGPFGMNVLPALETTLGAAQLLPGATSDPLRPVDAASGFPDLTESAGGDFRGGIINAGEMRIGRDARLTYLAGSPLHVRNAELWVFGVGDFGQVVADQDIVVRGADVYLSPERPVVASGVIEAGRDIRFVSAYAPGQAPFWANLVNPFDARAAGTVSVSSPVGFTNLGRIDSGSNIDFNVSGQIANRGTLVAADAVTVASRSLVNAGAIDASGIGIRVSDEFRNSGTLRSREDVIVQAGSVLNAPVVSTSQQSSAQPLYPGCTTGDIGLCKAVVESATGDAQILAGRDVVIDAPKLHNIGGSVIAGRNIDIATNDFLNQDRDVVANWNSTYAFLEGTTIVKDGKTEGQTVLHTRPGVMQAGVAFVAREWPRMPPDDGADDGGDGDDGSSGSDDGAGSGGGDAGSGTDGGDSGSGGHSGSGDGSDGGSGSGSGSGSGNGSGNPGGTPVVVKPPGDSPITSPVTPPDTTSPGVSPPITTPIVTDPVAPPPATTPIKPPSRFVNTGTIQAGAIVIEADDIRNGFDPVADYKRRTAPPSLPPATLALAAPAVEAGNSPSVTANADGVLLRKLLPPELGGTQPFQYDAATERAALRRAIQDSTGRTIILPEALAGADGLDAETRQWAALQANAAAYALTHEVALGTPLGEAQLAELEVPMLWYVEQGGRLVPQLVLPEADRARLARLPGGLLQADALISLSADKVVNTGYLLSGGTLAVNADELANLKRNAYYFEKRKVKGGTLYIKGDTVQPGGFMQALHWNLATERIRSRSGEFRVLGEDDAASEAASAALIEDIAQALGEDYQYEAAQDRLEVKFKPKKKGSLGGLIGAVVAVVVAIVATPAVSAWIAGAGATSTAAAAGSAWAVGGLANTVATNLAVGTLSSAAGQLAATGRIDLDAALRNGAVSGLTAGITGAAFGNGSADSLAGIHNQSGTLQPVAGGGSDWADRLLGIGARGVIGAGIQTAVNGTSFDTALRDALVGDLAALGANQIGTHLEGVERALAHAALGAISAELTGKDAAAGAIGALASALAAQPIDAALDLTGTARQAAVSALAMLSGGLLADALGHDPVTAANAALNEVTNNYLKHADVDKLAKMVAGCKGDAAFCKRNIQLWFDAQSRQNGQRIEGCYIRRDCNLVYGEMLAGVGELLKLRESIGDDYLQRYLGQAQADLDNLQRVAAGPTQAQQAGQQVVLAAGATLLGAALVVEAAPLAMTALRNCATNPALCLTQVTNLLGEFAAGEAMPLGLGVGTANVLTTKLMAQSVSPTEFAARLARFTPDELIEINGVSFFKPGNMNRAEAVNGYLALTRNMSAPYMPGTAVRDVLVQPGQSVFVIENAFAEGPGGWGASRIYTDLSAARTDLALLPEFKDLRIGLENGNTRLDDLVIREYQVKQPFPTRQGVAGPQTSADGGVMYAGGGKQVEFLVDMRQDTKDMATGKPVWQKYLQGKGQYAIGDTSRSPVPISRR